MFPTPQNPVSNPPQSLFIFPARAHRIQEHYLGSSMTQQQQQTDGVIPSENLEFPEATDTSASDATWFAELSDLADITDGDALSNDSSTSSFTPPPTYDLNLEDLPTFNLERRRPHRH